MNNDDKFKEYLKNNLPIVNESNRQKNDDLEEEKEVKKNDDEQEKEIFSFYNLTKIISEENNFND